MEIKENCIQVHNFIQKNQKEFMKIRLLKNINLNSFLDYYHVYLIYLGYGKKEKKGVRIEWTAEKCKLSFSSVKNIISLMEKEL
jgi:hypothetical protein